VELEVPEVRELAIAFRTSFSSPHERIDIQDLTL